MNNLPKFAQRLNELISEYEITQKHLAQSTHLTETSVSEYAHGISEPSIKSLIAIADYFKCTADFLTGRTDDSAEKKFLQCPPFSERLEFMLKSKGCSGYTLCKEARIPEGSFYDWKNGKTQPSLDNLLKISKYFDCTLDFLLGRES